MGDLKFMSRMRSAVEWSKQMDVDEEEVGGKEERKRGTWEEVSSVQKIHYVFFCFLLLFKCASDSSDFACHAKTIPSQVEETEVEEGKWKEGARGAPRLVAMTPNPS